MNYRLVYNDSTHAYTLNGRRAKSVTAVAKIAPDSFALEQWRKRQVAIGLTLDKRLIERVAVDVDNKEAVDIVCEAAMEVAGAHHAAHRGTQRHRASELSDLGERLLTEQQQQDAAAWQRTLDAYGIEILPNFVEGFAIWPEQVVVGRFDRIARYQGRLVVVDLKSGENAVKYPQSTAVQMSLYANAPLISVSAVTVGDRSTVTQWAPPPADLDLKTGYVVLLGDGMDVGKLYEINIEYGLEGARHALSLVQWRKGFQYGAELASEVKAAAPKKAPAKKVPAKKAADDHGSEGLHLLIKNAATLQELTSIWADADAVGAWREAHTEAARKRKDFLLTGQEHK